MITHLSSISRRTFISGTGSFILRGKGGGLKTRMAVLLLLAAVFIPEGVRADVASCVETSRPDPSNPALQLQEQMFGFHDEELVLCSPGDSNPVQIAARLWVPKDCADSGGCPGVVIAHGFGFNKEATVADAHQAVLLGMYVLSYDVRGQGASGGQAAFLSSEDIADQAAVLRWWHEKVKPTKTAFYGISQGGWLSWTAAVFNCGADRASSYDSSIPCDQGGRWIDAIAPVEGPTKDISDGTCQLFTFEAFAESRGNPAILEGLEPCITDGSPGQISGAIVNVEDRLDRIDVPVYAVTSFFDRLVPARQITSAYEQLHARTMDSSDNLYGKDVWLTISNEGHGAVGGNFAVTGDVFNWIDHEINGRPLLRDASATVAIAQAWAGNAFQLEAAWPIPDSTTKTLYLARAQGAGVLAEGPGDTGLDELRNVPIATSPPEIPFADNAITLEDTHELPDARLVYLTGSYDETIEITGEPSATIWVSSANPASEGAGQLNLSLSEVTPDGSAHPFSHGRRGLSGLGPQPVAVIIPLSVSGHRIAKGSTLMLSITPSDVTIALPARGADPFYVNHTTAAPSSITLPLAPVTRTPPPGNPPSGAAFTDDPVGTLCTASGLPC